MKRFLGNLMLLCCIVIFCFMAGEIVVRLFYSHFADYNMEMWRYASEMKRPMSSAKLPFFHSPNKQGTYYGVDIRTNSMGFRDNEYAIRKPKGTKRIIALGDSHTFGWGVPFEDLFSKELESKLNNNNGRYEVINMGIGNYNSVMELELFRSKGLQLDPDMVILMFFINDTEAVPGRMPGLRYSIVRRSYLWAFLFDRIVTLKTRLSRGFNWNEYDAGLYSQENTKNLAESRQAIRELIGLCRENNIRLLIVNIPELHRFKDYPFPYATDYIKELAQEAQVAFLDLLPVFSQYEPESLWVSAEDPHAGPKAHGIIATEIYTKIAEDAGLSSHLAMVR